MKKNTIILFVGGKVKQVTIEDLFQARYCAIAEYGTPDGIKYFEINPEDKNSLVKMFNEFCAQRGYTIDVNGKIKCMGIDIIGNKKIKRGYIKVVR